MFNSGKSLVGTVDFFNDVKGIGKIKYRSKYGESLLFFEYREIKNESKSLRKGDKVSFMICVGNGYDKRPYGVNIKVIEPIKVHHGKIVFLSKDFDFGFIRTVDVGDVKFWKNRKHKNGSSPLRPINKYGKPQELKEGEEVVFEIFNDLARNIKRNFAKASSNTIEKKEEEKKEEKKEKKASVPRYYGKVKKFDRHGFGYISRRNEPDIKFSFLQIRYNTVAVGDEVTFEIKKDSFVNDIYADNIMLRRRRGSIVFYSEKYSHGFIKVDNTNFEVKFHGNEAINKKNELVKLGIGDIVSFGMEFDYDKNERYAYGVKVEKKRTNPLTTKEKRAIESRRKNYEDNTLASNRMFDDCDTENSEICSNQTFDTEDNSQYNKSFNRHEYKH